MIGSTLLRADDFRTDWYGYVCNQAGHKARVTAKHGIEVLE